MTLGGRPRDIAAHGVLPLLVRKYVELADISYRVSVATHDKHGRFQKGHRGRRVHPALLKKVDLDRALERVYRRFFDPSFPLSSTPTSKRRRHGSEKRSSPRSSPSCPASRSE